MKRKIILLILIIGASLLLVGSILNVMFPPSVSNSRPSKGTPSKEKPSKLQEKHCLDALCLTKVEIINDSSGIAVINGTITNISNETIPANCIKLIFELEQDSITKSICYLDLQAYQTVPLELQHQDKNLKKATDYKIEPFSSQELSQVKVE